jgi:hypothetical protein
VPTIREHDGVRRPPSAGDELSNRLSDALAMMLLTSVERTVAGPGLLDGVEKEQREVLPTVIDSPKQPRRKLQAALVDRKVGCSGRLNTTRLVSDLYGLRRRVQRLTHQEQTTDAKGIAGPLLVLDNEERPREERLDTIERLKQVRYGCDLCFDRDRLSLVSIAQVVAVAIA